MVRVPDADLTEERRRDLIKVIKHEGENAKVAVRNSRRDANHALKELLKSRTGLKQERRAQDEIQKLTPTAHRDIDKMIAAKRDGADGGLMENHGTSTP